MHKIAIILLQDKHFNSLKLSPLQAKLETELTLSTISNTEC